MHSLETCRVDRQNPFQAASAHILYLDLNLIIKDKSESPFSDG